MALDHHDPYVASLLVTASLQSLLNTMPRITERDLRAAAPLGLILSASLDALVSSGYSALSSTWEIEYIDEHPIQTFAAAREYMKLTRSGAPEKISVWVQGIIAGDGLRIESFEFQ